MAIVKKLHLRRVVHQVASWVVFMVAKILVVLRIIHGISEHLIELTFALHWPWDDLVVHAAEHL